MNRKDKNIILIATYIAFLIFIVSAIVLFCLSFNPMKYDNLGCVISAIWGMSLGIVIIDLLILRRKNV